MATDIHRGLEKVDGSWVNNSTERYKVREEAGGSQRPLPPGF